MSIGLMCSNIGYAEPYETFSENEVINVDVSHIEISATEIISYSNVNFELNNEYLYSLPVGENLVIVYPTVMINNLKLFSINNLSFEIESLQVTACINEHLRNYNISNNKFSSGSGGLIRPVYNYVSI